MHLEFFVDPAHVFVDRVKADGEFECHLFF